MNAFACFRLGAFRRELAEARFPGVLALMDAVAAFGRDELRYPTALYGIEAETGRSVQIGTVRVTPNGVGFTDLEPAEGGGL